MWISICILQNHMIFCLFYDEWKFPFLVRVMEIMNTSMPIIRNRNVYFNLLKWDWIYVLAHNIWIFAFFTRNGNFHSSCEEWKYWILPCPVLVIEIWSSICINGIQNILWPIIYEYLPFLRGIEISIPRTRNGNNEYFHAHYPESKWVFQSA